jgi:predicted secreted protein
MIRVLTAMLLFTSAAHAADGAQSRAIGFSPDGKYFAFEQYGNQDGSGFTFSEIYVLDIAQDKWVPGTPVKILNESEESKIEDARQQAISKAAPIIAQFNVTGAFDTLVHMPFTEIITDRRKVRFARYYNSMGDVAAYEFTGSFELEVKDVKVVQPKECPDGDFLTFVGMEVTLKNMKTGVVKTLTKDVGIPKSRYCPHAYDLEAVFAPSTYQVPGDPLVALIGVYSRGFEGSDRRFIAVPFELFE